MHLDEIEEKHRAIHARLINWARWVRPRRSAGFIQPMFRGSRTSRQWDSDPHIPTTVDMLDAQWIEKAVCKLPEPHRLSLKWHYVYPVDPRRICRALGLNRDGLAHLVRDGRQMLTNRLAL